jgi:hypothetical protein
MERLLLLLRLIRFWQVLSWSKLKREWEFMYLYKCIFRFVECTRTTFNTSTVPNNIAEVTVGLLQSRDHSQRRGRQSL